MVSGFHIFNKSHLGTLKIKKVVGQVKHEFQVHISWTKCETILTFLFPQYSVEICIHNLLCIILLMDKLEPSKRVAGLHRTSVKELSIFDQAMADQRKRQRTASIPASLCGPSMGGKSPVNRQPG